MYMIGHRNKELEICEKTTLIFCAHLYFLAVFAIKLFTARFFRIEVIMTGCASNDLAVFGHFHAFFE